MKIRMLKTENGSLDGIRVTVYESGKEYDLTGTPGARDLAQAFVGARMAVEVKGDVFGGTEVAQRQALPEVSEPEAKAIEAAPENKAMAAPATKRPYNRKG